ncbi:MAG: HAD-IA family hydrolase [Vicinamibacterales bacterium]
MEIQAVIFDLFHTLTGPEAEWSDLPWTSDVLGIDRGVWNELLVSRSRWRLAGEETDALTIVRTLAREIDPTIPEERIQEATRVRIQRFKDSLTRIPPENVETLRDLRAAGFRLGLISNADVMEAAPWPTSPLAGLFDVELFSCAVGLVKPEPAIYARCIQALGVSPTGCLFVGDGGSNELVGAKAAGMSTVFVSGVMAQLWPERIEERRATSDHHVQRISELLPLLGLTGGCSRRRSPAE